MRIIRILLDKCVNAGVRAAFGEHFVRTVSQMGWEGLKDGPLVRRAQESFDLMLTIDGNLKNQQKLAKFGLGVVVARVPDNKIGSFQPAFEAIRQAVEVVKAGEVIGVDAFPAPAAKTR